jgi:hypothetical protein
MVIVSPAHPGKKAGEPTGMHECLTNIQKQIYGMVIAFLICVYSIYLLLPLMWRFI